MGDVLRAEIYKVVHRRMTYILLLVATGLVAIFYIALWLGIRQGPGDTREDVYRWLSLRQGMSFRNVVPAAFSLERFFVTLVSVIFAGTMMGNEYDWRTIGVVMSRGVRRSHFFVAKLISGAAFSFVTVVLCFLTAAALSAWFSHLYGLDFGGRGTHRLVTAGYSAVRTWFVILPFVTMAIFFAIQLRSAAQAVGAALGFYFIEGIFTALLQNSKGLLSHIPDFLFNVNGDAIIRANGFFPRDNGAGPFGVPEGGDSIPWAVLVLSSWIVFFVGVGFYLFSRRDIQE